MVKTKCASINIVSPYREAFVKTIVTGTESVVVMEIALVMTAITLLIANTHLDLVYSWPFT